MNGLDCNRNSLDRAVCADEEMACADQEAFIELFKASVFLEPYNSSNRLNEWLTSHSIDPHPVLHSFRKSQSSFFTEIAYFMVSQKLFPFARYFANKIEDGYERAGCLNEVVFLERKSEREFIDYLRSTGALLNEEKEVAEETPKQDAFHVLLTPEKKLDAELGKDKKQLFLILDYQDVMQHLDTLCAYRLFYEIKNCAQEFSAVEKERIFSIVNQKEQECFASAADYLSQKKCYHEALGLVKKMHPSDEKERLSELYALQMEAEIKLQEKRIEKVEIVFRRIEEKK